MATNGAEADPNESQSLTGSNCGAARASTIVTRAQQAALVAAVKEVDAGMTASLANIAEVGHLVDFK